MSELLVFRCAHCGQLARLPAERRFDGASCGACKRKLDVTGAPQALDDAGLERLIAASPVPVLVDFWADWCPPCKALAPHLADLAGRLAGRAIVAKVDVEAHKRFAAELGVQSIPTLCVYKDGELVRRQPGAVFGRALEALVSPFL